MQPYLDLLRHILDHGERRQDRTGVGTLAVFGYQCRYDLGQGFPLLTTKKLHLRSILHELLWFLQGDTNLDYLRKNQITIWDEWARPDGELGPMYGFQWRHWGAAYPSRENGIDQMALLVRNLIEKPYARRHLLSAWNVADLDQMALPPCHVLFQFYVTNDGRLSCQLYQRSADAFLGVPFNIASYALLTMMLAQVCGYRVGEFIHSFGDLHLYLNHLEQARLQLNRSPRPLPLMRLNPERKDLFSFRFEDFILENYDPHPAIAAPIAI